MIKQIIESISKRTDAHELFVKTAAYSIMSNNLGEFAEIPMALKTLNPNLYILLIGPPHQARKSTVLHFIKELSLNNRISSDVTYQYFIQELQEHPCSWQNIDEVSEVFQQLFNAKQMHYKNMIRAYLLLFNNERIERGTLSAGKVSVETSFFNFAGATTNKNAFKFIMSDYAINSGFLPRFLMPMITKDEIADRSLLYKVDSSDIDKLKRDFEALREKLELKVKSMKSKIRIFFNDDGWRMIEQFSKSFIDDLEDESIIAIASRYKDYIIKIAALEEIDIELEETNTISKKIVISIKAIEKAIQYISEVLTRIKGQYGESVDYNDYLVTHNRILEALKAGPQTRTSIYRKARSDSVTVDKVMKTLELSGLIFCRSINTTKAKKPTMKYYLKTAK